MIRLLIADDHAIVRDGLRQLFELFDDIEVVAEAADGTQILEALRSHRVDLLLLDMSMPGISGLDLISRIIKHQSSLRILVLSMHAEPNLATRALKAGVRGYLSKDSDSTTLVTAIRRVASGSRFLDPTLGGEIAFGTAADGVKAPHDNLSDREFSIMRLLLRGMGVNEIARHLAISNKTVSTHKTRLMKKLGTANMIELARYAYNHGLKEEN